MAIARYEPKPEVADDFKHYEFKSALVDETDLPLKSLIRYVEGSGWEVTYYSQYLDKDDPVVTYDPHAPDIIQQYTKIKKLILHVTQPLEPTHDRENNDMYLSGSGIYFNVIPPNVGDSFVVPTLGNKLGIFHVTDVTRQTYNKNTVYQLEYRLYMWVDDDPDVYKRLEEKVVKTYYFDKDNYFASTSPLLTSSQYEKRREMEAGFRELVDYYFRTFIEYEKHILVIPGQDVRIYDKNLVDFVMQMVNITDSVAIQNVQILNFKDRYLDQPTIWTALINMDPDILEYCNREMTTVPGSSLGNDPLHRVGAIAGGTYVIYPKYPDTSRDINPNEHYGSQIAIKPIPSRISNINSLLTPGGTVQLTPMYQDLDAYVFTMDFYNNVSGLTLIEELTRFYLDNKPLNNDDLYKLYKSVKRWGMIEQFYYIPILICLMRYAALTTTSIL